MLVYRRVKLLANLAIAGVGGSSGRQQRQQERELGRIRKQGPTAGAREFLASATLDCKSHKPP